MYAINPVICGNVIEQGEDRCLRPDSRGGRYSTGTGVILSTGTMAIAGPMEQPDPDHEAN